jgi:hypothetical protein
VVEVSYVEMTGKSELMETIPEWGQSAWEKSKVKSINNGEEFFNQVTEGEVMVFLERQGLLD